ncbi:hypothetical protein HZB07_07765 [Candidatus Saganbacteria bacterium]|nr:hypothetical protein [Candidatus Saganbacteria bacterium]
MSRKMILCFVLLVVAGLLCSGQAFGLAKKVVKTKSSIVTLEAKVVPQAAFVEVANNDEQIADLKEETNKALTELKNQIDKVKADNSDVKVGSTIFFRWQNYNLGGSFTKVSNFDIDRAYLDFKKKIDGNANARVTLDVSRISGAAKQNLFDYLKYAYVEMPVNVSQAQFIPFNLTAKLGLQHTVWIDWADKVLGLRFIAKSLLDNEGVMSSSDFGLGALGKFTLGSLPEVEYQATLLNGTGYATNESNAQKAAGVRLNSTLYSNENAGKIILGVFGHVNDLDTALNLPASAKQAGLGLGYQHELVRAYGEYFKGSKSAKSIMGYSLGGVLNIGGLFSVMNGYNLFIRADYYDPDSNVDNNENKKTFYGVTYDWTKDLNLALDIQNSQTGNGAVTSILSFNTSIVM